MQGLAVSRTLIERCGGDDRPDDRTSDDGSRWGDPKSFQILSHRRGCWWEVKRGRKALMDYTEGTGQGNKPSILSLMKGRLPPKPPAPFIRQ
ncbi:Hypothetical protein NTJ_06998 [Nesidiocoris tenuis]|uniref:Uncharacterized protein n=1 Tax=Nesidiocoris tenuis TaxID=355587 RepID=A0ABN7ARV1_9HEMI|nr:Hypothetical protein NTJ_06998 [Nesidiocoris tenuis]